MIDDTILDNFRINGTRVRVVRDASEANDILGIVVAWNEEHVLIRKRNRRVVKLPKHYNILPADAPRPAML